MKSLKAQLVAAIAMTLVAALTIGSSTYAWFTQNTAVSATGMSVEAEASGGLYIANYNVSTFTPGEYGTSATALTASLTMPPVSTVYNPVDAPKWFSAQADSTDASTGKKGSYIEVAAASLKDYALMNSFIIKTQDAITDKDLKITNLAVTGETLSGALNESLRVLLVVYTGYDMETHKATATTPYFFAPASDVKKLTSNNKGVSAISGEGTSQTVTISTITDVYGNLFDPVAVQTGGISSFTRVDVYVYYEGEDSNNTSANTANGVDSLDLTFTFKAVAPTT